jgi:hypothetical protein
MTRNELPTCPPFKQLGGADPTREGEATQPAADHPFGAPLAPEETDANQPPPPSDPPTTPAAPIPSPSKIGDSDDAVTMDIKDPKTKETQEGFEI